MKQIPLTQGYTAIVDDEDYDRLVVYRWQVLKDHSGHTYARRRGDVLMHQEILPPKDGLRTDHKNGDGLDNRRDNLRYATAGQNRANSAPNVRRTSLYKGVRLDRRCMRWEAYVRYMGVRLGLGYFATQEEAARAYNDTARVLHGEFARLNDV